MTTAIDSYINELVKNNISYSDLSNFEDFDDMVSDAIEELFNNYDDSWDNKQKPTLDEFMKIQNAAIYYLGGCDSLTEDTIADKDWKWWCNIYALSRQWQGDMEDFQEEWWINKYEYQLIAFQSAVRRRQTTIRVIKKLHLTGSL